MKNPYNFKNIFFVIVLAGVLFSCGSSGKKDMPVPEEKKDIVEENKEPVGENKDSVKSFEFIAGWGNEVYYDSTYSFEITGPKDSLANFQVTIKGGTVRLTEPGKYEMKVSGKKDSLHLIIDRRIYQPQKGNDKETYHIAPFKHVSIPIRKVVR